MEGEAGIKNDRDKFEKAPTVEVSPDLSDKFTIFERWLRENGTKTRKLELRDYGNEVRGCHATSEIVEDETIIEVPLKCLITVEMGKDTDVSHPSLWRLTFLTLFHQYLDRPRYYRSQFGIGCT